MSFGYSVGDIVFLSTLAYNAVQNSRRACGEHDELTREVLALHVVLRHLEQEVARPESPINSGKTPCGEELGELGGRYLEAS